MTGHEVMERALTLLNYADSYGDVSAKQNTELLKKSTSVINQILADIAYVTGQAFAPITKAADELPLSEDAAVRVLVPGVCSLIALGESDGDNQQLYTTTYNRALSTLTRAPESRRDVLPRPVL